MPVHVQRAEKEKPKSCTVPVIKYRAHTIKFAMEIILKVISIAKFHISLCLLRARSHRQFFWRRRKSGTSTSAVAVATAGEEPLLQRKPQFLRRRIFESRTSAFADYFVLPFLTKKNLQKVAVLETSLLTAIAVVLV